MKHDKLNEVHSILQSNSNHFLADFAGSIEVPSRSLLGLPEGTWFPVTKVL
jgi:hypothetical protein